MMTTNGADKLIYRLADAEVDPRTGLVKRNGQEHYLRPKTLQVLLYLIEQRPRLITKEELLAQVWQGTAVTDDALVQSIVEIRKVLGENSQQPRFIKTFPKTGYRFIGEVEALNSALEVEEVTSVEIEYKEELEIGRRSDGEIGRRRDALNWYRAASPSVRLSVSLSALVLLLALGGYLYHRAKSEPRPAAEIALPRVPGKRALAVLYFENQSGDRELDWLREGLADMLITSLARSRKLTLLSRQHLAVLLERGGRARAEKLQLADGLDIARRSQAELFVLGSFAKLGQQMRVDVQLFTAHDGQLQAAESLVVEQPGQLLARLDLLSLKLATQLGVVPADSQPGLPKVMTGNLDAYRYYSLALERAQNYHSNEALALLEKALALDPEFAMAYARIGYIHAFVRLNERARALPYLDKAAQLAPRLTERDQLYLRVWTAQARDDGEGVVRALYEVIAQDPRDVEAYFRLGFMLRHGPKRPAEALRVLEQAATLDPDAPQIHNQLGFLYQGFGRYDEAVAAHSRYVQLAPSEPNAYDSLGMSYCEAGRYDEALQTLNRALALDPDFHFATRHLGDVYFQMGRYRAALRQYQRYLALAPTDWDRAQAHHLLAWVHLARGELAQAETAARQEARYGNEFGDVLLVALARGQWAAAASWRARWLTGAARQAGRELLPGTREYLLGLYDLKTGQAEAALAHFKAAQQIDALYWNIATTLDGLGQAYLELGRWDEAIAEYERLAKLNPRWARAQYQLGQAYERKGERARAHAAYEQFLQVWQKADADIPEVIEAKKQLSAF